MFNIKLKSRVLLIHIRTNTTVQREIYGASAVPKYILKPVWEEDLGWSLLRKSGENEQLKVVYHLHLSNVDLSKMAVRYFLPLMLTKLVNSIFRMLLAITRWNLKHDCNSYLWELTGQYHQWPHWFKVHHCSNMEDNLNKVLKSSSSCL